MMTPDDPSTQTFTLRTVDRDGSIHETEMNAAQTLDLCAGRAIAFFPHSETILVTEDGELVQSASAIPQPPDPREDDPR